MDVPFVVAGVFEVVDLVGRFVAHFGSVLSVLAELVDEFVHDVPEPLRWEVPVWLVFGVDDFVEEFDVRKFEKNGPNFEIKPFEF